MRKITQIRVSSSITLTSQHQINQNFQLMLLNIHILFDKRISIVPDSKYHSRFPPCHDRLKTTFEKFSHSSRRRSCLECLPGRDAILTTISSSSNCHSRYQYCNPIRHLHYKAPISNRQVIDTNTNKKLKASSTKFISNYAQSFTCKFFFIFYFFFLFSLRSQKSHNRNQYVIS